LDEVGVVGVLERAAAYLEAHGLKSGSFGRPGQAVCVDSALAIGLGVEPSRIGKGVFFRIRTTPEMRLLAEVVLGSQLLEMLPAPDAPTWMRRRARPRWLSARQALVEIARWSDAPGRTARQAADALRAAARRMAVEAPAVNEQIAVAA
jgi:hypothetical protein